MADLRGSFGNAHGKLIPQNQLNTDLAQVSGNIAGVQRHGVALSEDIIHEQRQELEERHKNAIAQMIIDEINQLQQRLERLRADLVAEYGEEFAQTFAQKYLSDDVAQRRAGESQEDYERRIALALFEAHQNGSIQIEEEKLGAWANAHNSIHKYEVAQGQRIAQELDNGGSITPTASAAVTSQAELQSNNEQSKAIAADATAQGRKLTQDTESENVLQSMLSQNATDVGAAEPSVQTQPTVEIKPSAQMQAGI